MNARESKVKWLDRFFDSNWPIAILLILAILMLGQSCEVRFQVGITSTQEIE